MCQGDRRSHRWHYIAPRLGGISAASSKCDYQITIDEFFHKLPLEVFEEEARCAALHCLRPGSFKILRKVSMVSTCSHHKTYFLLSDIGHERHHLISLFDKPKEDA